jgi:hypothetical protein
MRIRSLGADQAAALRWHIKLRLSKKTTAATVATPPPQIF